jgi:hypothetical protein
MPPSDSAALDQLAHDLRTSLTIARLQLRLVKRGTPGLSEAERHAFQTLCANLEATLLDAANHLTVFLDGAPAATLDQSADQSP